MTTVRPAVPPASTRSRRRVERRRLLREQLLAVAVLLVAFLVTVLLLGLQWLHAGQPGAGPRSVPAPARSVFLLEVA
ncbi:MAG: hypothetical protein ACYDEN_04970 [Acidimicrobiales bacterium]